MTCLPAVAHPEGVEGVSGWGEKYDQLYQQALTAQVCQAATGSSCCHQHAGSGGGGGGGATACSGPGCGGCRSSFRRVGMIDHMMITHCHRTVDLQAQSLAAQAEEYQQAVAAHVEEHRLALELQVAASARISFSFSAPLTCTPLLRPRAPSLSLARPPARAPPWKCRSKHLLRAILNTASVPQSVSPRTNLSHPRPPPPLQLRKVRRVVAGLERAHKADQRTIQQQAGRLAVLELGVATFL